MAKFFYIARDKNGQKDSGVEDAATQEEVVNKLQARGLIVINIIPKIDDLPGLNLDIASKVKLTQKHSRITGDDLVLFCRQLATLLGAGVTILKSLEIISMQVASRKLYGVIKDLQKKMESGLSFHESMAKHPDVFSELWINLVESGEASGNLAMVLGRLAGYLERNAEFRRKVVSALIYPVILMLASLGALLFLGLKIIPTFADLFKNFNLKLPLITSILVASSSFLKSNLLFIIIATVVLIYLFRRYIRTNDGRRQFENFLFNIPKFGEFFRALIVERFTSEMSTLIESGVPILYSLEIAEHSVGNLVFGDIVGKIKDDVRAGKTLSQPLEKSGFFDPMAVQMVTIGEEIGELSNMFKKLNSFYQEYVDTFLTRFTAMFEPFVLVFMGLIVGVIVIGMFLPIFQIAQLGNVMNK